MPLSELLLRLFRIIACVLFMVRASVVSYNVYSCPSMFWSGTFECLTDHDRGTSVLRLTSSGLPSHYYDPARGATEQLWEHDFPLRPALTFDPAGGIKLAPGQIVGFAKNGVPYRLADPTDPAFTNADGCLGMVDSQTTSYYYATVPPCLARGPDRAGEHGKERFHDQHQFDVTSMLDAFSADRAGFPSPIIGYALGQFLPNVAFFIFSLVSYLPTVLAAAAVHRRRLSNSRAFRPRWCFAQRPRQLQWQDRQWIIRILRDGRVSVPRGLLWAGCLRGRAADEPCVGVLSRGLRPCGVPRWYVSERDDQRVRALPRWFFRADEWPHQCGVHRQVPERTLLPSWVFVSYDAQVPCGPLGRRRRDGVGYLLGPVRRRPLLPRGLDFGDAIALWWHGMVLSRWLPGPHTCH